MLIDLSGASEAVGENTTYYGGTIRAGDKALCIDGWTDRGDHWADWVLEQLLAAPEFQGLKDWLDSGVAVDGEEQIYEQIQNALDLGHKYEATYVTPNKLNVEEDEGLVIKIIQDGTELGSTGRVWKGLYANPQHAAAVDAAILRLLEEHPEWGLDMDAEWDVEEG